MDKNVVRYTVGLGLATVSIVVLSAFLDLRPSIEPWGWLLFLGGGLAAAEQLRVRFRRGDDVDAVTLFEAVLAPLIFSYSTPAVVVTVALAQAAVALGRRSVGVKALFNITMWSLAAGVGSLVFAALATGPGLSVASVAYLMLALTCVAVINNTAFTLVLAISRRQSVRSVLRELAPIIVPGWIGGWAVNLLMGLLFVMAYTGHPSAVLLFPVPLAMLHLAYRGYASARVDRWRLTGLRAAAHVLSAPLDPRQAIDDYLCEVATCFESRAAALILATESGTDDHETHLLVVGAGPDHTPLTPRPATALEHALAMLTDPVRRTDQATDPLGLALAAAGWRDCLCAPLIGERRRIGAVVVFDQTGLEGNAVADLAVLEALARETAHTLARGRLLERVLDERRKLDQIVGTTSDGIFTLDEHGVMLSWNAACEQITGLTATEVLGRTDPMARLSARTAAGEPIDFGQWAANPRLPRDLRILTADGADRRLSCSVSRAASTDDGAAAFVVVARDITPAEEYEELRNQFSQLVEAQAAQRLVVDHLQRAVAPDPPEVEGADIAVTYLASDPSSPTGGDLYDWQLLPTGELHVAVVDVLGHGVGATKAALTVVHTLRVVAVEGTPLEHIVTRAHDLLAAQQADDLVATVVVAHYDPATGALRVVSGGHPPALIVHADGTVTQLAATGGAIGWPGVGSDNVVTAQLAVGESLVLYTDGLIEARKDILQGMDALVRHAAAASHLPAAQYANELVERSLAGAERRDDSLALVVQRTHERAPIRPVQLQRQSR